MADATQDHPQETPTATQKRPLEEPSSPSGPNDQPDAKRQALDKVLKEDAGAEPVADTADPPNDAKAGDDAEAEVAPESTKEPTANETDKQGDTVVPDATAQLPPMHALPGSAATNGSSARAGSQAPAYRDENSSDLLHVRAIISSPEAATVIGKGGENVSQIRKMAGARCTVSEYNRGAVERILTVIGQVDAVAKAFGLIIRTLNQESLEAPSNPHSKTYPLRLLIPHILIGSIIGKQGVRIREIQEASGARLNASEQCLPLSTERSLVVLGVADAIHIATYYVGSTLSEQLIDRFGSVAASAYAGRQGGPQGVVPGGMQVVPYQPQHTGGQMGGPDKYRGQSGPPQRPPAGQYGAPLPPQGQHYHPQPAMPYGAGSPRPPYTGAGPQQPQQYGQGPPQPSHAGPPQQPVQGVMPGQPITQQIFIPNDMVGAIIGKGGAKINEIRQLSGSVIKINEPTDNNNERLVTVSGTQECNQMALYMLYARLDQTKSDWKVTKGDRNRI